MFKFKCWHKLAVAELIKVEWNFLGMYFFAASHPNVSNVWEPCRSNQHRTG